MIGYRVLRDGSTAATLAAETTEWLDEGASSSPVPDVPAEVEATVDASALVVSWQAVASPEAPLHEYRVVPLFELEDGEPSPRRLGRRAASAAAYEVRLPGGSWLSVGSALSFTDDEAPVGSFAIGPLEVGRAAAVDGVPLDVEWMRYEPGAQRTYAVRAVNASGASAASAEATGRRLLDDAAMAFQWERVSAAGQAGSVRPPALSSRVAFDEEAPSNGGRAEYRLHVTAPDGTERSRGPAMGFVAWRGCPEVATFGGQVETATQEPRTWSSGLAEVQVYADGFDIPAAGQLVSPAIEINGAQVIAVERFSDGRFRVADGERVLRVQLEEGHRLSNEDRVEVGQRISFEVTRVGIVGGYLVVTRLRNLVVNEEDGSVQVLPRTGDALVVDELDQVVRVTGRVGAYLGTCGTPYHCYLLEHGPRNAERTDIIRTNRTDVVSDVCVTFIGPLNVFPGPYSSSSQDPQARVEVLDHAWVWRTSPVE
ncbi:MAG: hypothetical protein EA398_08240 [Deltaproteobacteria bacterium]|nr:MAG: hypothetical protein EA398_08240 [Deltaproteobacteria bacterium]